MGLLFTLLLVLGINRSSDSEKQRQYGCASDSNCVHMFYLGHFQVHTLALEQAQPVLATPVELATAPVEALKTAPIEAVAPTGEPIELTQVVEPPPPAAAEPVTVAAAEPLPKTASPLPLIALIGLLTIGAGFALSAFSKRAG
jgi:hypothetical protein